MPKQSRMPSLDGDSSGGGGGSSGGSAGAGAGVWADGCRLAGWQAGRRQGAAGSWRRPALGGLSCRCGARAQLAAAGQDSARVSPRGAGLRRQERAAARPAARPRGGRASLQRYYSWNKGEHDAGGGGSAGDGAAWTRGSRAGGARAAGAQPTLPRAAGSLVPRVPLSPGFPVGRPRSPRPPPSQRRASSRPGSPGNH